MLVSAQSFILPASDGWSEKSTMNQYKVHRFDLSTTKDKLGLEAFLNGLEGEIVAVVPNVTISFLWIPKVDFLLVIEKLN